MFLRVLMTVAGCVFWMIAGILAIFMLSAIVSIFPPFGPFVGPFGGLLLLLVIASAARGARRQRGAMVLNYLKQALSLNLPIPPMLAAASASERGKLRRRLDRVRDALVSGRSISQSLRNHVPEIGVRPLELIAAGERVGRLPQVLDRLVNEERQAARLYSHGPVLGWNYGVVLLLCVLSILSMLATFIMPKFREIFEDFDAVMPWQTVKTFEWFGGIGLPLLPITLVLIAAVAGWALFQSLHGIEGAARPWRGLTDRLTWVTPFIGTAARDRGLGDACRLIAESLKAGYTIETSACEAAELGTNVVLRRRLRRFADGLQIGRTMRDAAEAARLPCLMTGMLATGQAVAEPVRVFDFLSRYYTHRFSRIATLIRASALPVVVLVMSLIVGWIVYSMMLPLVVLIEDAIMQVGAF